jgi:hypothetical protein
VSLGIAEHEIEALPLSYYMVATMGTEHRERQTVLGSWLSGFEGTTSQETRSMMQHQKVLASVVAALVSGMIRAIDLRVR